MHSATVQMNITHAEAQARAWLLETESYEIDLDPVSYTHLTLPTICSV